jgi:1-acyl-sn-glycerol-3-phosphate acyltransferase
VEKKIPACDQGGRAAIEAQLQEITRDLLRELGNTSAVEGVPGSARLDEDLGLESIERAELMARLNRVLGTGLPESAIAEARTLDDIVTAIAGSSGAEAGTTPGQPTAGDAASAAAEPFHAMERSSGATAAAAATRSSAGPIGAALETVYGIYAAGVFIVWLVLAWLLLKLMPPGQPAARMTSVALRIYFRLVGRGIVLIGGENIEAQGASIYVSNHTSYADVLVVMALFGTNYHFVAKSEINDMPFIGSFLRKIGHFSFERGKIRARSRQIEQMEKALLSGKSVFVFAEGTFTVEPGVRPFHLGAFRASVKTGKPIVPVALKGAREFLRDGTFLPKPRRITLTVSPALFPASDIAGREWAEVLRLRDETRRIISSNAGEPLLNSAAPGPRKSAGSTS